MSIAAVDPISTMMPQTRAATPSSASATSVVPREASSGGRILNPDLHIDPALGIVITEYFNRHGDLTAQYPTAKVIENYRVYGMSEPQPD